MREEGRGLRGLKISKIRTKNSVLDFIIKKLVLPLDIIFFSDLEEGGRGATW